MHVENLSLLQGLWGSSSLYQPHEGSPKGFFPGELKPSSSTHLTLPVSRESKPDCKWQAGPAPGSALVPAGCLLPWVTGHITASMLSSCRHSGQAPWEGDWQPLSSSALTSPLLMGDCHLPACSFVVWVIGPMLLSRKSKVTLEGRHSQAMG